MLKTVNYNTLAYATSEPATITLSVRYDNAIQTPTGTGIGTAVTRTIGTLSNWWWTYNNKLNLQL